MFGKFLSAIILTSGFVLGATEYQAAYLGENTGRMNFRAASAAKVFSNYFGRVTSKKISSIPFNKSDAKVIFLITEEKYIPKELKKSLTGKPRDSFIIKYPVKFKGKTVCLMASRDNYAYDFPVYYFLNKYLGVDWVGPGKLGEVIPVAKSWKMPKKIDITQSPDYIQRYWADWKFKHARPLLAGSLRMDFHHALGKIFDVKKYGKSDPDVYPIVGGKRFIPHSNGEHKTSGWQPCMGNPKSQRIAADYIIKGLKKSRLETVSLSVNDGVGNICECEACRKLDCKDAFKDPLNPVISDRIFRFYVKALELAKKKNPDAKIAVLAYNYTSIPPKEVKLNKDIVVFLTGKNPPEAWKKTGASLATYQYTLDNAYMTVRHFPNAMAAFLKNLYKLGGTGLYAQLEHSWAAGGPRTYVMTHLLWDVNSDVNKLMDDYCRKAYGTAAKPMREYFDHWEAVYEREYKDHDPDDFIWNWNSNQLHKLTYLKWDDLKFFDNCLKHAKAIKTSKKQSKRIAYADTYYQWIRSNAAQYLMARDLQTNNWLKRHSAKQILNTASKTLTLTKRFDRLWEKKIAADRSGWLLCQKPSVVNAVKKGRRYYDSLLVGPTRIVVEDYVTRAIAHALKYVSGNKNKADAIAFWKKQSSVYPSLKFYFTLEINRLNGVKYKNYIVNGDFSKADTAMHKGSGLPPVAGWWYYDEYGMVRGIKGRYEWKNGTLGFGPSKYPGARQFVKLPKGIYRLTFKYRSKNRKLPIAVNINRLTNDVKLSQLSCPVKIRTLKNTQYLKFLQRSWPVPDEKWEQRKAILRIENPGFYVLSIEPFFMGKDQWVWFDDVKLEKID